VLPVAGDKLVLFLPQRRPGWPLDLDTSLEIDEPILAVFSNGLPTRVLRRGNLLQRSRPMARFTRRDGRVSHPYCHV